MHIDVTPAERALYEDQIKSLVQVGREKGNHTINDHVCSCIVDFFYCRIISHKNIFMLSFVIYVGILLLLTHVIDLAK